jgi:CRISPR-associated protein Csd1
MTILQSLAARYDRMAAKGEAPVPGFGPAQISFTIVLDSQGKVVTVDDERGDDKFKRPRVVIAPQAPKRTAGVASGVFWDKTSYVLGRTAIDPAAPSARQARDAERLAREHAAFMARHEALLATTQDDACLALLAFLRGWDPVRYDGLAYAEPMLDQNIAFRLDGEAGFIHDRPAARTALIAEAGARDASHSAMCLVTGVSLPIARLHPSIKGVPGAQSAGAALVSFNLDAFTSYGRSQGDNAPVSEAAAFAYTTALNSLLTSSGTNGKTGRPIFRNRIILGDITVVYWAEIDAAERITNAFFAGPPPPDDTTETHLVRQVMQDMEAGKPLQQALRLDPATRVSILGLSPNAARLSVRFWVEQSLGDLAARFAEHWQDMRIEPLPHLWPPPIWALLHELAAQRKAENVPEHLAGEFTRAILTGLNYPRSLLAQTIMRIRADQDREDRKTGRVLEKVSDLRVALLKACLARMYRKGLIAEDVPVSLDLASVNPAYRLGRLFSVLERLQMAALGQRNATIRDRFYASASATPAIVFPSLVRNARNHSKTLRSRIGPGLAEWFEDHIAEIASGLEGAFPKTLPLEEQGRFALGYYHQRDAFRRKKDVPAALSAAEADADPADEAEPMDTTDSRDKD